MELQGGITNSGRFTAGTGVYTFDTNTQTLTGTFSIPSVTVNGVTLNNSGTLTVGTALAGTGGLTQGASATLNLGGTSTITTLAAAASLNTVNYNGAAQTVLPVAYYHLTLSGSGAKTRTGVTTIGGNLTLSGSATMTGNAGFTVTGALNYGSSGSTALTGSNARLDGHLQPDRGHVGGQRQYDHGHGHRGGCMDDEQCRPLHCHGHSASDGGGAPNRPGQFWKLELEWHYGGDHGGTIPLSGNLTIPDGATFTAGAYALTVTGTTTVGSGNSGILTITSATGTKTFTGAVTINAGGALTELAAATLSFGFDVTISGTLTENGAAVVGIGGSLQNNGTYTASTGVHTFSGTGKTISGTGASAISIASVTVSGTYQNNGTLTVGTALGGSGTLTQGPSSALNLGGTSAIATLAASANVNTVNYNGAIQTVEPANYNSLTLATSGAKTMTGVTNVGGNLTLSGSATATLSALTNVTGNVSLSGTATATTAAALVIGGNLSIGDGTTFTATGFALTVTGTTAVGAGASGNLTISSATGTKIFTGLVTINTGATWNNSGNSALTFRGGITSTPTFTGGSGVHTFDTAVSQTLTGTFTIPSVTVNSPTALNNSGTLTVGTALAGTGTLVNTATGTLNLGGTSAITALTATASGNTVNFSGAAQTVNSGNYYNLALSGSLAKTLATGTTAIGGNLTLSGTATATTVVGLAIGGNLVIGTGTTLTVAGFDISVTGTTSVTGTLTHNSATGAKTYTGDVTINTGGNWNENVRCGDILWRQFAEQRDFHRPGGCSHLHRPSRRFWRDAVHCQCDGQRDVSEQRDVDGRDGADRFRNIDPRCERHAEPWRDFHDHDADGDSQPEHGQLQWGGADGAAGGLLPFDLERQRCQDHDRGHYDWRESYAFGQRDHDGQRGFHGYGRPQLRLQRQHCPDRLDARFDRHIQPDCGHVGG